MAYIIYCSLDKADVLLFAYMQSSDLNVKFTASINDYDAIVNIRLCPRLPGSKCPPSSRTLFLVNCGQRSSLLLDLSTVNGPVRQPEKRIVLLGVQCVRDGRGRQS